MQGEPLLVDGERPFGIVAEVERVLDEITRLGRRDGRVIREQLVRINQRDFHGRSEGADVGESAVRPERLAGDEACGIGKQEVHQFRGLLRIADALQWMAFYPAGLVED